MAVARARLTASILLFVASAGAQTVILPFTPVDAEYSKALDRIIIVSAAPSRLHIYNPATQTDTPVALAAQDPLAVSVSPDGLFAAVGHANLISYVNLSTATVVKTLTVSLTVRDLILAAQYVYIPPTMTVSLATGAITNPISPVAFPGAWPGRFSVAEQAIFYATTGFPNGVERRSVADGVLSEPTNQVPINMCSPANVWLVGARVYSSCGQGADASSSSAYYASLPDLPAIVAMDSSANGTIAAIPGFYSNPVTGLDTRESEVHLFSGSPPRRQGILMLPELLRGNASYGKWIFFDSVGASLYVLFASSSGPGFHKFSLSGSGCSNTATPSAVNVGSDGGIVETNTTSVGNCAFQLSTSEPWINVIGTYGAGTAGVRFLIRPNTGAAARTGTVAVGTTQFTVTQAAAAAPGNFRALSFKPNLYAYSKPLDRLLLTSKVPSELHILDPVTGADSVVSLPHPPTSLTLYPGGQSVAVGSDGFLTTVNLLTGAVGSPLRVFTDVTAAIVNGNGNAYLFSTRTPVTTQPLGPGAVQVDLRRGEPPAFLQPGRPYIFAGDGSTVNKWEILPSGVLNFLGSSVSAYVACGVITKFWSSEDGDRLFTSCRVYRPVEGSSTDLIDNGKISGLIPSFVANSTAVATSAVFSSHYSDDPTPTESVLYLIGDEFLSPVGSQSLPAFSVGANAYPGLGRAAYWNSTSDKLFVLTQADKSSGLLSDYAIYTLSAASCATAAGAGSASFVMDGGAGTIPISAPATCAWKAGSNAAWLTVVSGGFGLGSATVNYRVARNDTGAARSGVISVGGRTFTVSESTGTLTLSPTAAAVQARGGSLSVAVTASNPSMTWTVQSASPWLTVTSSGSGTGNGTVTYTAAPNAAAVQRSGTIVIGGVNFAVTQAGSPGSVILSNYGVTVGGQAGSGEVDVTSSGPWIAASNTSWIKLTSPANGIGSGNGRLTFSVEANPDPFRRVGTVTINGIELAIFQDEAPLTVSFDPPSLSLSGAGGGGTIRLTISSPTVQWIAFSNAGWLVANGDWRGGGTITYSAAPNTSGASRTGSIVVGNFSMVVTQSAAGAVAPPSGLLFVPASPCRLVDTRENRGAFGSPSLAARVARTFVLPDGNCGIPTSAKAYSLNVTVVPKGPLGYLTIWPAGSNQPLVSTLNSVDGRVKANAALVPAGTNGGVSIFATDATDLVLDMNGYFVEPPANTNSLAFFPISPCRVSDTRLADSPTGGPIMSGGSTRNVPVRTACGIPAEALAYSLNATVVPEGPLGYLTLWPTGQPTPLVSTLNSPRGNIVANAAIVPAGAGGQVSAFVTSATHLVLDINGYFAPPGSLAPLGSFGAQRFFPVTPCRILDTRNLDGDLGGPVLTNGQIRNYNLAASNCSLPSTARAFSLNATVVPESVLGYLTLWGTFQPQPLVSTLNAFGDPIVANAALVPAGSGGSVTSFVTNRTHFILDTNGYFAP